MHALFGLCKQRRWNSQSGEAIPGADKRGIEQERRLEIGDRILLAALRLVDVAAVVVGERVDGIERDSRGVIVDRTRQVSGPAVGEAAPIEGARAVWIEPDRLREVGNRRRQVALDEACMAPSDVERRRCRCCRCEAKGSVVVVDRCSDIAQRQLCPRAAGIPRGVVGAKTDRLIEVGHGLRAGPSIGPRVATISVGERLFVGAVCGCGDDIGARAQSNVGVSPLAAIGKRICDGPARRRADDKARKPNSFHHPCPLKLSSLAVESESHVRHWWYLGHAIALMEINGRSAGRAPRTRWRRSGGHHRAMRMT